MHQPSTGDLTFVAADAEDTGQVMTRGAVRPPAERRLLQGVGWVSQEKLKEDSQVARVLLALAEEG